jgi:hypothetical protein
MTVCASTRVLAPSLTVRVSAPDALKAINQAFIVRRPWRFPIGGDAGICGGFEGSVRNPNATSQLSWAHKYLDRSPPEPMNPSRPILPRERTTAQARIASDRIFGIHTAQYGVLEFRGSELPRPN